MKYIIENIDTSVLVIGPGIMLDKNGNSLQAEYFDRYLQKNSGLINHYFNHDHLIRPKNSRDLPLIQKSFASFYKNEFSEKVIGLYRKISQIPFPLIISLNPDDTMIKCYEEQGIKFFDYAYGKGRWEQKDQVPTKETPCLYNLLGCYKSPGSLILTYEDMLDYFRTILPGDGLPPSIKLFLLNATNIIFLGVEFDKWYFQLLVKLLTESDPKFDILRVASPDLSTNENVRMICEKNFGIDFVGPHVANAIDELYYYSSMHEINNLRGDPILSGGKVFNPEIYISYKHSGKSEELAKKLFEKGNERGYRMIFDQVNLDYRGNPWEFMKQIGWGKYVIVIVSSEYLKSEYCMFEFNGIIRNNKKFEERVFPIVLSDVEVYSDITLKEHEGFWTEIIKMHKTNLKDVDTDKLPESIESIVKFEEIRNAVSMMMRLLNKTNCLTDQIHEEENFQSLFSEIDKQIELDLNS